MCVYIYTYVYVQPLFDQPYCHEDSEPTFAPWHSCPFAQESARGPHQNLHCAGITSLSAFQLKQLITSELLKINARSMASEASQHLRSLATLNPANTQ